jgi:hypothetical protein
MSKILYWIDDAHDKSRPLKDPTKRRLEAGLKVDLQVQRIDERKEFDDILHTIEAVKTCGVILDYQLTGVSQANELTFGNAWAAEIRAKAPSLPVIGVSHANLETIPKLRLEGFLEFYPRDELLGLHPPIVDLAALLTGYAATFQIYQKLDGKSGVQVLRELVDPPKMSTELFENAIPMDLTGEGDEETPHVAGRWIWHELLGRQGLLFDDLGIATYLGLNRTGFSAIADRFKPAIYKSAFASAARPRWWVSGVRPIVEKILKHDVVGSVASFRGELLKTLKVPGSKHADYFSKAHARRDPKLIPDCVAYRDDGCKEKERIQALVEDTRLDPRDENMPFGFEARRIFKPASSQ